MCASVSISILTGRREEVDALVLHVYMQFLCVCVLVGESEGGLYIRVCVCVQVADPVGKSFTCIYSEACFSQTTLATMVPKKCHGVSDFVFFFTQVRTSAAPPPTSPALPSPSHLCCHVCVCLTVHVFICRHILPFFNTQYAAYCVFI